MAYTLIGFVESITVAVWDDVTTTSWRSVYDGECKHDVRVDS